MAQRSGPDAILLVTLLSACATQTVPEPKIVQVPVALPCQRPEMPVKPDLALSKISPTSTAADVVRAYAASLKACQLDDEALRELLR